MDRQKCRNMENAGLAALKGLEDMFGVKISFKGGRFDHDLAKLTFEFAEVKADGSVATEAATNYKMYAKLSGLPADGLGRVFGFRSRSYKVIGFKPRSKYSILAQRLPDGKTFKFEPRTAFPELLCKPLFGCRSAPGLDSEADERDVERDIAEAEGS
jgi:hypothetical protein